MFSLNSDSLMSSGLNISYFYEVTMLVFEAVVTKGKVIEHNYGKRIPFCSDAKIIYVVSLAGRRPLLAP